MATNKKKSSGKTKEKKAVATAAATKDGVSSSSSPPQPVPSTTPQQLSMPQLTALIFLAMGASRILQVRSAYLLTAEGKASGICVEHLGGEAPCTDATIVALLQYKYGTALLCLLIAAATVVQCWFLQPEAILSQLNALFTISPIAVGLAAMKVSPSMGTGPLWKQAAVGVVLGMLALPTSRANVPFWGSRIKTTSRKKTLPAMVLGGLAVLNLLQAVNYIGVTVESEWVVDWMLPLQPEAIYQLASSSEDDDDQNLKTAATPILYFLAVDCLTLALIFAFSWHALPDASQRSVLLMVACAAAAQYRFQLPTMEGDAVHERLFRLEQLRSATLTAAFVAGVAWILPDVSFQKRKPTNQSNLEEPNNNTEVEKIK